MNFLLHIVFGVILLPFFGIGLILFAAAWVGVNSQTYTVTTKRVIQRTGIFSKNTAEVAIRDIRSVNVSQGGLQRLFGLGTIDIGSAGHAGVEVQFQGVARAQAVKKQITELIQGCG